MKINLLYHSEQADRRKWETAFSKSQEVVVSHQEDAFQDILKTDLSLEEVLKTMGGGNPFLRDICEQVLFERALPAESICYRQEILKDCIAHPQEILKLYEMTCQCVEINEYQYIGVLVTSPEYVLKGYIRILEEELAYLRNLYDYAKKTQILWKSSGMLGLCETLKKELSPEFLGQLAAYIDQLSFRRGFSVNVSLGRCLKPIDYVLQSPPEKERRMASFVDYVKKEQKTIVIPDQDETAYKGLSTMKEQSLKEVAVIIGKAVDDIKKFFFSLKTELSFYIGAMNLHDALKEKGYGVTYPKILGGREEESNRNPARGKADEKALKGKASQMLSARGAYNVALALTSTEVAARFDADFTHLTLLENVNKTNMTVYLRSIGQALFMMQAGLFVCAEEFQAVSGPVFTHFLREEDTELVHGKLDEELDRMSQIISCLTPGAWVLMNESLASTNEYEGSEILHQIQKALYERGIHVVCLTHFQKLKKLLLKDGLLNYS